MAYEDLSFVPEGEATLSLQILPRNGLPFDSLHPRIRGFPVNGVQQEAVEPDTARLRINVTQGGTPVTDVEVTLRAQLMNGSGGHQHNTIPVDLDSVPLLLGTGPER